jgi:hypothetical protein
MLQRIAVCFRRRSQEEPRIVAARELQHVACSRRAGLQGLDRIFHIKDRTGKRCQMKDPLYLATHVLRVTDVMFEEFERGLIEKMPDVSALSGNEVVNPYDFMALLDQAIAEV